jgi:hypothetical protein
MMGIHDAGALRARSALRLLLDTHLLVAQAQVESMTLLTDDGVSSGYGSGVHVL